jgi:hypothetical protein
MKEFLDLFGMRLLGCLPIICVAIIVVFPMWIKEGQILLEYISKVWSYSFAIIALIVGIRTIAN